VLLLKVLESVLEGHDDDEEEQEGMLPAMKVNEKFKTIILRQRAIFKTSGTLYRASLVKTGRARIGRPSTYAPTISTIINRIMLRKERRSERKYTQLTLQSVN
jgi:DNA topoisomerase-1